MRSAFLFVAGTLGVLSAVAATPSTSQACCFGCGGWGGGWGGGWRGGYGYGYAPGYAYSPGYSYAPGMQYMPGQPMPGMQQRTPPVAVSAKDDSFDSANLTIQPGQTVRFTNSGKHVHTVTSNDNKFDSGDIPPGRAFDVTFMSEGTYKYHCKHHKGMEGTITVKAAKSGGGSGAKVGE